jgi:hypothetical protein
MDQHLHLQRAINRASAVADAPTERVLAPVATRRFSQDNTSWHDAAIGGGNAAGVNLAES